MGSFGHRGHRPLHLVQRLKAVGLGLVLCLFGAALSVSPVSAQSPGSGNVNVTPQSSRFYRTASGDLVNRANVEALVKASYNTPAAGGGAGTPIKPSTYHSLKFPISPGTLGGLAKNAIKGGLYGYLAMESIKSLIEGAGWVIDELQGQVTQPPTAENQPSGTAMWCNADSGQTRCTTTQSGAVSICRVNGGSDCVFARDDGGFWNVWANGVNTWVYVFVRQSVPQVTPDYGTGSTSPTSVSNEQLGQVIANSPRVANDVLTDPNTGVPHMTPELAQAMNKLAEALAEREGMDAPSPITASPNPGADPTLGDSEFPDFCGWADRACEHMDWMENQEPSDVMDLPESELEIDPNSFNSGLGNGACPAPRTFTVSVLGTAHTAEFSFQPVCDFALMIKTIFITCCGIYAAVILAGLRKATA